MANQSRNQNQLLWLIPVNKYKQELKPISGIRERFLRKANTHNTKLMMIKMTIEIRNSPFSGSFQSVI